MTVVVTHKFTSPKADPLDATLVRPSNWNDTHNLTCAANSALVNSTGSTGPVTEAPLGAMGLAILATVDLPTLLAATGITVPTTGDVKLTLKTAADTGWIMMNDQTIGNTSSGATYANANAQALYTLLWNNVSNTYAPVTGGRGASAAADWAAQKPMQLLSAMGRALGVAGAGSGLTSRALGQTTGEETHTLSTGEIPTGLHTLNDPGHTHSHPSGEFMGTGGFQSGTSGGTTYGNPSVNTNSNTTGVSLTDHAGGGAHNNMQPTTFFNVMIKL